MFLPDNKRMIFSKVVVVSLLLLLFGAFPCFSQGNAPSFTLRDINTQKNVNLSDFKGLITLLFFFQTNDQACIDVATRVELEIQRVYGTECTAVVGISGFVPTDTEGKITQFAQTHLFSFPVLYDPQANTWQSYNQAAGKEMSPPLFVIINNEHNQQAPNIMVSYDFQDYFGSGSSSTSDQWFIDRLNESIQIQGGASDLSDPWILMVDPTPGDTIPLCDNRITIGIFDDCAIDRSSAFNTIRINNADALPDAVWTPDTPTNNYYEIDVIIPQIDFAPGNQINLEYSFADLHGNVVNGSASYTVATENTPPLVSNNYPANGAVDIPLNASIFLDIVDFESCVNQSSIVFYFGKSSDTQVPVTPVITPLSPPDTDFGYSVSFNPSPDLEPETNYTYYVEAQNMVGMILSSGPQYTHYSFTTVSQQQQTLPEFTNLNPTDDNMNASPNIISFVVTDQTEGINPASITLTLNGNNKAPLTLTAIPNGYAVSYAPLTGELPPGNDVNALASASTPSGLSNNSNSSSEVSTIPWSFRIGDPDAPIISGFVPEKFASSVSVNTYIKFQVTDNGRVNSGSITLNVNQQNVTQELNLTTITNGYSVLYKPKKAFSKGDTVSVAITARDMNGNSASENYTFTIQSGPTITWAGYMDTFISSRGGGYVKIAVKTSDPKDLLYDPLDPASPNSNIVDCRLFNPYDPDLSNNEIGHYDLVTDTLVKLSDNMNFRYDMGLGALDMTDDGLYIYFARMPVGIPEGQWGDKFSVQASNSTKDWTHPWPYYTVTEVETPQEPGDGDGGSDGDPSTPIGVCPENGYFDNSDIFDIMLADVLLDSLSDWRIKANNWINSSAYSAQPPANGYSPMIYLGGIEPAVFPTGTTSPVTLRALVYDPDDDIEFVRMIQGGNPVLDLFDDGSHNDYEAGDGWFGAFLDTNITPGFYKIELIAEDEKGNPSHTFPYITVDP